LVSSTWSKRELAGNRDIFDGSFSKTVAKPRQFGEIGTWCS
jgi:hypothetical protein